MSIRIITHCWAGGLPQYAQFLKYQLSSLILYRPQVDVGITVCYCRDDIETVKVLRDCICHTSVKDLGLRALPMTKEELGRRSIGRDRAAQRAWEDVVWFADVDMVFREGCLDAVMDRWRELAPSGVSMIYPRDIKIHKDHATGDAAVEEANKSSLRWIDINPDDFVPKRYTRAIGGVQIVGGDFARKHGYLNDSERWQTPRTDGKPFGDFKDDIIYRRFCEQYGKIVGVEIPEVYRLRHTQTTYQ